MGEKVFIACMRIMSIAGQICLVKLYTRYLLPAQLGQYFFYQTASYFLNALLFVPIDYFQQAEVFHLQRSGNSLGGLLTLNKRLLSAVGIVTAVIGIVLLFANISLLYAFLASAMLSVTLYVSTAVKGFLNNQNDQKVASLMMFSEVVLRALLFFAFQRAGLMSPIAPLVAMGTGFLIVALVVAPRILMHLAKFHGPYKPVPVKLLIKFTSPISLGAILNWLQLQAYNLILVPMGYSETLGLFATVYNIGNNGMNAASAVYSQIYLPRVYQTAGKYLRVYLRGAAAVTLFVLAVGFGLRHLIVKLVTNGRFVNYSSIIAYGVLVEAGNLIIGALAVKVSIDGNTYLGMKAGIFAVISVPVGFTILHFTNTLNGFTIGVPLVISQAIIIIILLFRLKINPLAKETAQEHLLPFQK